MAEPVGQVVDRDLAAGVDLLVERVAVVDQDLGNLDVELPRQCSPVGEPALRLLGQAVDQDQRRLALVGVQEIGQVEPVAHVVVIGGFLLGPSNGRTGIRSVSNPGTSLPSDSQYAGLSTTEARMLSRAAAMANGWSKLHREFISLPRCLPAAWRLRPQVDPAEA